MLKTADLGTQAILVVNSFKLHLHVTTCKERPNFVRASPSKFCWKAIGFALINFEESFNATRHFYSIYSGFVPQSKSYLTSKLIEHIKNK